MISTKYKKVLRGRGHNLNPSLIIGKDEITDEMILETNKALETTGLIKIRVGKSATYELSEVEEILNNRLLGECVQKIGRNFLWFNKVKKVKKNEVKSRR